MPWHSADKYPCHLAPSVSERLGQVKRDLEEEDRAAPYRSKKPSPKAASSKTREPEPLDDRRADFAKFLPDLLAKDIIKLARGNRQGHLPLSPDRDVLLAPADGYLAIFAPPVTLPAPEAIKSCRQ